MSFFDVPEPPEPPTPERRERPAWFGPQDGVLPAISDERVMLISTDEVLLAADQFLVYPTGISFKLSLTTREFDEAAHGPPWEPRHRPRSSPISDETLRFGLLFADGTKWTNLDWRFPSHDEEPTEPVVLGQGGGGGGTSWSMRYWLWPLPPADTLSFVVAWPMYGVTEHRVDLDITAMLALADSAQVFWA